MLTGGRLTAEDAYAYSKFARVALGTNDIDFRARPHSAEEADFLAAEVVLAPGARHVRRPRVGHSVVLVGLEPEDEAGAIFLRLRKAHRKHRHPGRRRSRRSPPAACRRWAARWSPTAPGGEAAALDGARPTTPTSALDAPAVILVGERLATVAGRADRGRGALAAHHRRQAGLGAASRR